MHQKGTAGLFHENNQVSEKREKKEWNIKRTAGKQRWGICLVLPSGTGSSAAFQTGRQNRVK